MLIRQVTICACSSASWDEMLQPFRLTDDGDVRVVRCCLPDVGAKRAQERLVHCAFASALFEH